MSVPPTPPSLSSALAALALAGVASASFLSASHPDAALSDGVRLAASVQPLLAQDGSPSGDDQDVSTADGSSKTRQTGLAPGSGQSSRSDRQTQEPESKSYLPDWLNWMDSHPAPTSGGDGGGSAAASGGKSDKKPDKETQPSPEQEQQPGNPKASDSQGGKSQSGGDAQPSGGDTGAGGDQGWIGKLISSILQSVAKALGGG